MDFTEGPPPEGLVRLFGADRFRFGFNLRPGEDGWFEASKSSPACLRERRAALGSDVAPGLVWSAGADAAWREFAGWAPAGLGVEAGADARVAATALASRWAPDFVLLDRTGPGEPYRMRGGAVCLPSAWNPGEKLGLTVAEIHGVVPTLNAELGPRIDRFLDGLRPGELYERENWSVVGTPELRLHPALKRPRLGADSDLDDAWFRMEEQAFVALPGGRVLVFLIHIRVWPLRAVAALPGGAEGLALALESMPPAIAEYKGLASARPRLVSELRGG